MYEEEAYMRRIVSRQRLKSATEMCESHKEQKAPELIEKEIARGVQAHENCINYCSYRLVYTIPV